MRPSYLLILVVALGPACATQRDDGSKGLRQQDPRAAAVALSIKKFFSGNWNLRDSVIYVEEGPYRDAIPNRLSDKTVEVISEDDLIDSYDGQEVAPQLVRITVSDGPVKTGVDFHVSISISAAWREDSKFSQYPLGGTRIYEFTVESGRPVLGRVEAVMH